MKEQYSVNPHTLEDACGKEPGRQGDMEAWEEEKGQLKHLLDHLQRMSQKMGAPIMLSVHPSGNKCAALYHQAKKETKFEGDYCFMRVLPQVQKRA